MSNIAVTHADSGLVRAKVARTERISPHFVRVTLTGGDLDRFVFQGFDQWFRLVIPVHDADSLDAMPDRYGLGGFLRYRAIPGARRPVVRNYTARAFRPDPAELDVDFVVHGIDGVAAPWAVAAQEGDEVALIDQGRGWRAPVTGHHVLVADESGVPAVAGILRDLDPDATGVAVLEVFDPADRQELPAPGGFRVEWLVRRPDQAPGALALPRLAALDLGRGRTTAFAVGESALATGARRHLVRERAFPKEDVVFCGYWKRHSR
jgi:NADPH-dependent ferric siderophore reductase